MIAAVAARQQVLAAAYAAHPERFGRGMPSPPQVPEAVWINRPRSPEPPAMDAELGRIPFSNSP